MFVSPTLFNQLWAVMPIGYVHVMYIMGDWRHSYFLTVLTLGYYILSTYGLWLAADCRYSVMAIYTGGKLGVWPHL